MRTWIVVNPTAGRGRALRVWRRLEGLIKGRGLNFELFFTERPGHAIELGRQAAENQIEQLVAVGGDGTLHELVNGLGPSGQRLAIIPAGTGNDLARTLRIPQQPEAALDILLAKKERTIDLGMVNGHYFTNIAGIGFDAEVAYQVNTGRHYLNGTITYLVAVLTQLWSYRCRPAEILLDGEKIERRIFLVAVGNAKYYGGGMQMVPTAEPDDGALDVVLGWDFGRLETLRALTLVFSGRHTGLKKILVKRAREVEVRSTDPLNIHADGEFIGTTPARFQVARRALRIAVP